jgi:NitT/TauT family transport system substrate-binding protein
VVTYIDRQHPVITLAGLHLGCYELFGSVRVKSVRDLRGKTVPVEAIGGSKHLLWSSMAAYVGLDPHKDINWVALPLDEGMRSYTDGKADAFLGFPLEPQEVRARKIGQVIVNTAADKPWSQYYCCMLISHRGFVEKYPVATKRATRALLKAVDLCAQAPERVARAIVDHGLVQDYDYALETLKEVHYAAWRTYDPENTLRFYGLRVHDVGLIRNHPSKLIAQGTDWRFLSQLRNELKASPGYLMKAPPSSSHAMVHERSSRFEPGTFCSPGPLGCWRAISGHLPHAPLANSYGYWPRGVERQPARSSPRHNP